MNPHNHLQNCSMSEKGSAGISLVAAATADAMDVMDVMMSLDPDSDLNEPPDWWVKLWSRDLDDPEDPDRIIPRPDEYKDYQCIQGFWIKNGICPQTPPTPPSRTPPGTPPNTPGTPDGPPPDSPVLVVDSPRTPPAISGQSLGNNGQLSRPGRPMATSMHSPKTPEAIRNGQITPPKTSRPVVPTRPTGFFGVVQDPDYQREIPPTKPSKKTHPTMMSSDELKRHKRRRSSDVFSDYW